MKPRSVLITGASAVVTASLMMTASAASTAEQEPRHDDNVLNFDLQFQDSVVDVGAAGFTVGDPIVLNDTVLNRHGRAVGVQGGTCTITALLAQGHFRTYCTGSIQLPGGQLAFQGLVTDAPVKNLAVTGGTGRYAGAAGTAVVTELGHDEAGTLTVRLAH
jgi:Allene oxide cyclase barrel like domain